MKRAPSFRDQLADLRSSLLPYAGRGSGAFHPVIIRPALAWSMVPRPRPRPSAGEGHRTDEHRKRERIARLLDGAPAPSLGLVEGSEFDAEPPKPLRRNGLKGLTSHGGKKIEDFCRLVKEERGCFGIWTVTLPPEVAAALDLLPDGAGKIQCALARRFSEALGRACAREAKAVRREVRADWAFVAEVQKTGRPHWHFVFRCKSRRGRPWLLGKGRLDRLIRNVFRSVTGGSHRFAAAGNVQALRKDPGSYLSSYLKKGASQNAAATLQENGYSTNLVPHQWWGMSRTALALVEAHRFELPSVLVGWLSRQWPSLAGIGALDARLWTPEAEGAPTMVVGSWRTISDARRCIDHLVALMERTTPTGIQFGRT